MSGFSPRTPNSARAGEIDTRAPFQSVKDAVSLFGDTISPKSTPVAKKPKSEERVLEKETQHHMMMRELECYKDHLRSAETAKAQALRELEKAKFTLQELTHKLDNLNDSKHVATTTAQSAKIKAKQLEDHLSQIAQEGNEAWKAEIDAEREGYKLCSVELAAHKQDLETFKNNFDTLMGEKTAAVQKVEDMQRAVYANQEKQCQLTKEVAALREKIENVKAATMQAQEDHSKKMAEKESLMISHKEAKEAVAKQIKRLKRDYIPKETLMEKLESTMGAIKVLQDQLGNIQASDLHSIQTMASELDSAKTKLQQVLEEEDSIRSYVESIKLELEETRKERSEIEPTVLKTESIVQQMQIDLQNMRTELETAVGGCIIGMQMSLRKLSAEAESAAQEAEERNKKAELLKQETSATKIQTKEVEHKLKFAVKEAKEAKAAEKLAEGKIHTFSLGAGLKANSGSQRKIRLSVEEFDSLIKKIEESGNEANIKVATANEEIKSINERETEVSQQLEMILKEKDAIQLKINSALKRADMGEAAKMIVESELQKWQKPTRNPKSKW